MANGDVPAPEMEERLLNSKCSPFEFLALYEARGFSDQFDGIIGLSPKKNETLQKQHFLWSLKEYGLVERAMVSFSIAASNMPEKSYALFGGYNSSHP